MGAPENAVKNACLEYLKICKIMAWSNNTGAVKYKNGAGRDRFLRFGYVGSADIIGCLPDGRFLAVECKAEKGRLSEAQTSFLASVKECGGVAVVARSIDDVAATLAAEGYA
jgi:hypothetical protein